MKKALLFPTMILLCISIWLIYKIYDYYACPHIQIPYHISNKHQDDTLRIAYIGDSWAYMHREHECQISKLLEKELLQPVIVHSYGVCGFTSKKIHETLSNHSEFKQFLQNNEYDYCYISAGINDTYKKMSIRYYKQSMDGIIQLLLFNNIHPIIQEIPDYDIQLSFERQEISRKFLRRLSMIINNIPLDCKQVFRDALDEMIHEKNYADKVSILRYKSWNGNGVKDLNTLYRSDRMHLNDKGYATLDSAIAKEIITHFKLVRRFQLFRQEEKKEVIE